MKTFIFLPKFSTHGNTVQEWAQISCVDKVQAESKAEGGSRRKKHFFDQSPRLKSTSVGFLEMRSSLMPKVSTMIYGTIESPKCHSFPPLLPKAWEIG